jgi:hypothetical protein
MWSAATELVELLDNGSFGAATRTLWQNRLKAWQQTGNPEYHPAHWSAFIAVERRRVLV